MTREHECYSKNIAKIINPRSCVHVFVALQIVLHLRWEAVVIENFGISQLKMNNLLQWLLITFCNKVFLSTLFRVVNNVVDDCSDVTILNNIINNYQQ